MILYLVSCISRKMIVAEQLVCSKVLVLTSHKIMLHAVPIHKVREDRVDESRICIL